MADLRSGVARLQGRGQCQLHGKVRFATLDPNGSALVILSLLLRFTKFGKERIGSFHVI